MTFIFLKPTLPFFMQFSFLFSQVLIGSSSAVDGQIKPYNISDLHAPRADFFLFIDELVKLLYQSHEMPCFIWCLDSML